MATEDDVPLSRNILNLVLEMQRKIDVLNLRLLQLELHQMNEKKE